LQTLAQHRLGARIYHENGLLGRFYCNCGRETRERGRNRGGRCNFTDLGQKQFIARRINTLAREENLIARR
jgi:hypothetical protein